MYEWNRASGRFFSATICPHKIIDFSNSAIMYPQTFQTVTQSHIGCLLVGNIPSIIESSDISPGCAAHRTWQVCQLPESDPPTISNPHCRTPQSWRPMWKGKQWRLSTQREHTASWDSAVPGPNSVLAYIDCTIDNMSFWNAGLAKGTSDFIPGNSKALTDPIVR